MYKLYSIAGSCSTGIHILLRKLRLPVEIVMRNDVDNYAELVATNQVPALQTEDKLLTEGAAIALYLLEKHSELPGDLAQRSEFRQWLMFNYATLHPAYSKLFAVSGAMDDSAEKQALLESLATRVSALWRIVEQRLEHRTYVVGEEPSLIDYLLAIYSLWGNYFPELNIELGEHTQRLIHRVMQLPEFVEASEAEGLELAA